MLSKGIASFDALPAGAELVFEPKWDGFRCIVFRDGDEVVLGSRNERPLTRYFPELVEALCRELPPKVVVDGEIVVPRAAGLDFDALQQRIHPAESRVQRLAAETPAAFIAFDLLAIGADNLMEEPFRDRRVALEAALGSVEPPIHLTPATTSVEEATDWFHRFEGAGLDGVVAKPADVAYIPDKRVMFKVKHHRTADCAVAGFRMHKDGKGVGSLLLGLFDDDEVLHHVGVCASFAAKFRVELLKDLEPLRENALDNHPWRAWAQVDGRDMTRMPGGQSRWSAGKDLSWEPLRVERVCEVKYDHLQGDRFRHAAVFLRWRPDKPPRDCRYDQLEVTAPYELEKVFGAGRHRPR